MFYIVEVIIDAENLMPQLRQMIMWLDHMKCEAVGFRKIPEKNICRVDFEREGDARAFVEAFSGRILYRAAAQA